MIPEAGQRFGPYEILGRLGGGGMGLVLRAWDERLHRTVAIKLLYSDYRMPGMRERFLQEARAASSLNHPHICTIFDIGEQDGVPYLVMELLEGETLKDRIVRGALPVEEIVRYGQEITEALAAAHAKGIVHRDIKPANIFLVTMPNGRSQAKVLDFGLAQIGLNAWGGWQSRTLDLTLEGATVGTLAYMSPEQSRGETLDARSDLFSLGIVLYEMATRQVPFRGTTSATIFEGLLHHAPEPVRTWNESVPRELERVILKLLTKDKRGRFQTAKELHEALTKIAVKMGRGRWLHRGPAAAAVPLVRPIDPVARHKGPGRKPAGRDVVAGETLATVDSAGSGSSADNMMIRPVRMPVRERDAAVVQPNAGAPAQTDSSAAAAAARAAKRAEKRAQDAAQEPMLARSRSGVTQFEYGVDELVSQEAAAERPVHRKAVAAPLEDVTKIGVGMGLSIAMALIFVAGVIFLVVSDGLLRPVVLGPHDKLLLTEIRNTTGDSLLDGTVTQGMEVALRQTASLNVLDDEAYRAGARQIAAGGGDKTTVSDQAVAQKVGAKVYLNGEISRVDGSPYTIRVSVFKAESNGRMTSLEETAMDQAEIPAAIDRLARRVGVRVGGSGVWNGSLERAGTNDLKALHAYAAGEAAMQDGRVEDALAAYRQAVGADPKFVQAYLRLAWVYRSEKAEAAAASAAKHASSAAEGAGDKVKLLAQFCYEMNALGDYGRATETIREYVAKYPTDAEGMKGLARALRVQGYLPEALLAAQQGYGENPFDPEMYVEAEIAMVGLDLDAGVLQLQRQAQRMGVRRADRLVSVETLKEDRTDVDGEGNGSGGASVQSERMTFAELDERALALDYEGRSSEGLALWRAAAAKADKAPELISTKAYLLAQGALDRALVENCAVTLEMVNEIKDLQKGPIASSNAGIAAGLCGDKTYADKSVVEMQRNFPQNTLVTQYYIPEIVAAAELGANDSQSALHILNTGRMHEQISLLPYLRGVAHDRVNQMSMANADFQMVLAHRGLALMGGGTVYPMAQLGVARTYAISGDKAASVAAYQRFLEIWSEADRAQPGIIEASSRSR